MQFQAQRTDKKKTVVILVIKRLCFGITLLLRCGNIFPPQYCVHKYVHGCVSLDKFA